MLTEKEYKAIRRKAAQRLRAGDLAGSIAVQEELVEQLMAGGPQAVQAQPALTDQLERASGELVDALRWDRQYDKAIALQDRLVEYLPATAQALRVGAANLRIENGQAEEGLAQLEALAAADADNFWLQLSLGLAYLYVEQLEPAGEALRRAAGMAHARKVDRGLALQYLVKLYGVQGKTDEALQAWREACRMDAKLRAAMLPAVTRMLVYWHKFTEASDHIFMESDPVRSEFYRGLLFNALAQGQMAAASWKWVATENDPANLKEGHDEYAEACVRQNMPDRAIAALQPLVDAGQTGYFRGVVLGLAYAQKRDLARAAWFVETALRLGDMERPRRTMAAPQGRIHDMHARVLYVQTPIDPDVRMRLERYFSPVKK